MTTWKDDLARQIASLKDEDWEKNYIHLPTGGNEKLAIVLRTKELSVEVPSVDPAKAMTILGTINRVPFCGAPARCLMIVGVESEDCLESPPNVRLGLLLRATAWDQIYSQAGKLCRITPAPYKLVDFDAELPA